MGTLRDFCNIWNTEYYGNKYSCQQSCVHKNMFFRRANINLCTFKVINPRPYEADVYRPSCGKLLIEMILKAFFKNILLSILKLMYFNTINLFWDSFYKRSSLSFAL